MFRLIFVELSTNAGHKVQARADYIDIWRIKVASEGERRTANALGWIRKSVSPTSSISAWMCSGTGGAGQDAEADGDGDAFASDASLAC